MPAGDVTAFLSACERLVRDGTLRERMSAAAAQRVACEFSLSRMAQQFERSIEKIRPPSSRD